MSTFLIHAPIEMRAFNRWAGRRELVQRGDLDEGFALHILLSEMFGPSALKPFRMFSGQRRMMGSLYAYADYDHEKAISVAEISALPDPIEVLNPRNLRSKPLRTEFANGQQLGFDVRVRPVRRLQHDVEDSQSGRLLRKGAEIDAHRSELLSYDSEGWKRTEENRRSEPPSRESSYFKWLTERLAGSAEICSNTFRIASFSRTRIARGRGRTSEGPDAVLNGNLIVLDPTKFAKCLRDGIGRHKSYGYGMLLLRPPSTRPPNR